MKERTKLNIMNKDARDSFEHTLNYHFIDAGANKGQSIDLFKSTNEDYRYSPYSWAIYAFEPHPYFKTFLTKKDIHYINKAVWTENTVIPFYVNPANNESQGSSLIKDKISGDLDKEKPIYVETIDFSSWLKSNFYFEDKIILRMDIEGAEYEVLRHMIDTKAINLIDHLIIEFHHQKINYPLEKHNQLIDELRNIVTLRKLEIANEYH